MTKIMSEFDVKQGLKLVLANINRAASKRQPEHQNTVPRLVAVSKTKPVEDIIKAYEEGQRHFGENYIQELEEKANNALILERCKDIRWHLIGHLQGNKVNKVINIPNLYIVETVDTEKLASKLNKNWGELHPDKKLNVFLQVNTSGEQEKSGISPDKITDLTKHVLNECKNLSFNGLMTIGQYGYNEADGPNPDFLTLLKCREKICNELNLDINAIEISMGMSTDYEMAVEMGSTNVRVGSAIFGYRLTKN